MGFDEVLKLIGAFISVITVGKLVYELAISRKARLREDYKFAKEFFDELSKAPKLHPLVIERGYHAIAGGTSLSVREVEYLLSLENPSSSLRSYELAREYLDHLPESGPFQVKFKKKYSPAWARKWRKGFYLFSYFVCALLALLPMFFLGSFKADVGKGLLTVIMFGAAFGIPAYYALKEYERIHRGEKLVTAHSNYRLSQ